MATICLISPGHLSSNPRIVKEADALFEQGHIVHVVYAQSNRQDLDRDTSILARRSWLVHPIACFGGTLRYRFRRLHQLACGFLFRQRPQSISLAVRSQNPLTGALRRAVCEIPADLYIAHYVAALPAAAAAARRHQSAYGFDAEDFHLGDPPDGPSYDNERQITRTIEAAFLPGCSYMTAASPGIADAYTLAYRIKPPTVVRNVFPLTHAPESCTPRGTAHPGPSIYWFSQTIGPNRGLECTVRAIAKARARPHLYLRGFINPGFRNCLETLARSEGVADRLHLLPPAPPAEMERLAATYDLGLVAETGHTLNRRIALTNKLYTYALAGVPALISDIKAHRDYAQQANSIVRLFRVDDPQSLATAIDSFLVGEAGVLREARLNAFQLGQDQLNWDVEQAAFLDCVSHAIKAV